MSPGDSRSTSTPSRFIAATIVSRFATSGAILDDDLYALMTVWSPPPPPIETRTLTPFACAAAVIVCTSDVSPRLLPQVLVPLTVAKARFRCVILVKSIWVAQLAKVPLQLSRYMTALMAGVPTAPASGDASMSPLPPESSAPLGVVAPGAPAETPPPPASSAVSPPPDVGP